MQKKNGSLRILGCTALGLLGCARGKLDFQSMRKTDAHVHIRYSGPEFMGQATADHFSVVAIVTDHYAIPEQQRWINVQRTVHPASIAFLTSFTVQNWDLPDWREKTIAGLKCDFDRGALGVKVWKNLGMDLRDKNGAFVMIDDARFDPIFDFVESRNKTLTGHIGEPHDCWLSLDRMIAGSNRRYYANNPQYHMALHPEYPSYEDQIRSVSNMLKKHPNVRYVGCHLASIEWNLRKLSQFLDAFPNAAVDLAARVDDIQYLDRTELRKFFIRYQDRILYGTDLEIHESRNPADIVKRMRKTWTDDWKYFSSDSLVNVSGSDPPVKAGGLDLPESVLGKIYHGNAVKWYPGIKP